MFRNDNIDVLKDNEEVRVRDALSMVLDISSTPQIRLLKKANWKAVPVESSDHFSDSDLLRIAEAINNRGDNHFYALAIENIEVLSSVFRFNATLDGLKLFNDEMALFSFAVFPKDVSWMIICTKEDYYIVVGEDDFVVKVLGVNIDTAYINFGHFAAKMNSLHVVGDLLAYITNQLREIYVNAGPGEWVSL